VTTVVAASLQTCRLTLHEEPTMTTKARKLLDDALKLPRDARADLAAQLWNSLDEQEWLDEIESRVDDVRKGKVQSVPFEAALKGLRNA
jgi:putative addiction module component (TIGR02574 family)